MDKRDKYYLINYPFEDKSKLIEGNKIVFEMPSFCSGDYTAIIEKDEDGLYIPKKDSFFEGCRDFWIIEQ